MIYSYRNYASLVIKPLLNQSIVTFVCLTWDIGKKSYSTLSCFRELLYCIRVLIYLLWNWYEGVSECSSGGKEGGWDDKNVWPGALVVMTSGDGSQK